MTFGLPGQQEGSENEHHERHDLHLALLVPNEEIDEERRREELRLVQQVEGYKVHVVVRVEHQHVLDGIIHSREGGEAETALEGPSLGAVPQPPPHLDDDVGRACRALV
eukprot:CAMPEP_0114114238 /NCGR_PEP_ID=MMETSP0043_2-20121206/3330_2 /TAXON_ID=464988 /ORGANISM="Hemiselmis andersenii, Strain CCMP644" /LENGTH=108 /DNA_ID=CAMNT_0001206423 /DNA_START=230 /DNA_END=557 /DNA_ORIENTATION=-